MADFYRLATFLFIKTTSASQVVRVVKNPPANAGEVKDAGLIPGPGRSPGGGRGNLLQCVCLENPTDRGASGLHGVAESATTERRGMLGYLGLRAWCSPGGFAAQGKEEGRAAVFGTEDSNLSEGAQSPGEENDKNAGHAHCLTFTSCHFPICEMGVITTAS